MKTKILAIFCSVVIIATQLSVFAAESEDIQRRLAAGDVCGIISGHECDHCAGEDISTPAVAETCPDCGSGTLRSVCSGVRKMNSGSDYFYVDCYVSGHPAGCQTGQTRYYTDITCTNTACSYRVSGSDWHIQSYFHSMDSTTFDDHYCSLLLDPRSSDANEPSLPEKTANSKPRDPVAAGDVCALHIVYECGICPVESGRKAH